MSEYKVKTLIKTEPVKWLNDGSFLFKENNFLYWCIGSIDGLNSKFYRMPVDNESKLLYQDKMFYYNSDNNEIIEYNPLLDKQRVILTMKDCPDILKVCVLNNLIIFKTYEGYVTNTGKVVKTAGYYSNEEILTFDDNFLILYKIIKGSNSQLRKDIVPYIDDDDREYHDEYNYEPIDRIDHFTIDIYKIPEFELLYHEKETPLKTIAKSLDFRRIREIEQENLQYIKDHYKIISESVIQLGGHFIEIKKKTPKEKKKCCICFKKPKTVGLLMFCKHKDFCYECVKSLENCPICREAITEAIEV